jgi:multiple sugar transport system substrate-binding protein
MKRNTEFCYSELAEVLRVQIKSGYIRSGEYLLSETELSQKYGISRTSVRRALLELQNEQLVVKLAGKGTVVSETVQVQQLEKNELVIVCPYPSMFCIKALPILIQMFEERCPGVEIKMLTLPYKESLFEELSALGIKADLFIASDQQFRFMPKDAFTPISSSIVSQDQIPPPIYDSFVFDKQLFAAPVTYSPVFLAYRKDVFQRYNVELPRTGWSIDQFISAAKSLTLDTDDDGLIDLYGMALSSAATRWPVFALKKGADPIGKEGKEASLLDWMYALSFMQDMIYRHRTVPIFAINDIFLGQQLFEEGRVAMTLTSTLALSKQNDPYYNIAPFPVGFDKGGMLIANGMMVAADSSNKALAQLFIEQCLDPDVQLSMIAEARFLSVYDRVNSKVWSEEDLKSLGVQPDQIIHSKCIGDLFPVDVHLSELEETMKMYWSGLEEPQALVRRLHDR